MLAYGVLLTCLASCLAMLSPSLSSLHTGLWHYWPRTFAPAVLPAWKVSMVLGTLPFTGKGSGIICFDIPALSFPTKTTASLPHSKNSMERGSSPQRPWFQRPILSAPPLLVGEQSAVKTRARDLLETFFSGSPSDRPQLSAAKSCRGNWQCDGEGNLACWYFQKTQNFLPRLQQYSKFWLHSEEQD